MSSLQQDEESHPPSQPGFVIPNPAQPPGHHPEINHKNTSPPADGSATSPDTMPQFTSRDVGDPNQMKKNKQSMADLKLRRLTELNNRLREDLERERIPVSQASKR